ncbi:MAG TPA: glycosyltransferase, partial [Candidatus Solibacter sp.]|nr:glycosyltransferase [Candidatus Solibacter sp.]
LGSQLSEYDPKLSDFGALGIHGLQMEPGAWIFDCGYQALAVDRVEDEFPRLLGRYDPDVVWSNSFLGWPLLRQARDEGRAAVWYLHDRRPDPEDLRQAAGCGVRMIAVSRFIRDRVQRASGAACGVVYPLIGEPDYAVDPGPERFVTFINPRPVKGYKIFLAIAGMMPEVRFLVVEGWPLGDERTAVERELALLGNVTFLRQLPDTREIYRQSKLLLVPSVVEEGGPRVIREAQLNGIPVLGSCRGGVPEMVGAGGMVVENYEDATAWAAAIRQVLDDPHHYADLARAALRNAHREELMTHTIVHQFKEVCRSAVEQLSVQTAGRAMCPGS